MAMGRKRQTDKHLPRRVYLKSGTYWFVGPDNVWVKLGRDYGAMLRALADLPGRDDLTTLGSVMDRYELVVIPAKAEKTRKDQPRQLARLREHFGARLPDEVKPKDIYAYCDTRPPVARLRDRELLSHVYTKAIEWGAAESNPCQMVRLSRPRPRTRYITDGEYFAFRATVRPVVACAMDLALITGQRLGDILGIRLSDLRDDGIHFEQRKTGKRLIVGWTDELREVVQEARQLRRRVSSVFLLSNSRGMPFTTQSFKNAWQKPMKAWADAGNERFTFHDIRAKSGSDAADDAEAQSRLGHSSVAMTRKTYRRAPSRVLALDIRKKSGY